MSTIAVATLTLPLLALLSAAASIPSLSGKGSSSSLAIYSVTPAQWVVFNSPIGSRLGAGRPINIPAFGTTMAQLALLTWNLVMAQKPRRQIRIPLRIILEAMNMQVLLELLLDSTLTLIHANWGACQATSQSCYLNSTLTYNPITSLLGTCYQESVPNYYAEVQQVSDVQKTMEFGTGTQYPLSGQEYRTRLQRPLFSTQQPRFMDA
jgi:hypothetical protein